MKPPRFQGKPNLTMAVDGYPTLADLTPETLRHVN
jgi:hypothetical protein